jgi:arsenite methyltransferase
MAALRGEFGVDAPKVLAGLSLGALADLVMAAAAFVIGWWIVGAVLLLGGLYLAATAASFAYTTLRGKFLVWATEVDRLGLRGDETTLDLGPGRGAVLILVAQRLPTGHATGIDLWRSQDQSGNTAEAARRNAVGNGVAERTQLVTGDMRALPFDDATFDVVTASLALHNIPDPDGRATAVGEALRVLKPGGRLRLADFQHTTAYAETLHDLGATDVTIRDLGWRFWYGGPWFATRMVQARKPA